ncbi:MAG: hypothetical protein ACRDIV_05465 [Ktedonobacteraceae bacterium]
MIGWFSDMDEMLDETVQFARFSDTDRALQQHQFLWRTALDGLCDTGKPCRPAEQVACFRLQRFGGRPAIR